ncbi:MCE family protein, partial [Streptomyces sp. wa1063]
MRTSSTRTVRRRLAGVTFLLVPAVLVWVSISVYEKDFTDDATVTVRTGAVGNEMHDNADVKLRGVVIGQVRSIATDGDGARLTLAIDRDKLDQVPADVTAQMLPTTLFGARFVALVPPRIPTGGALRAGAVIPQDRSSNAIELEQVLDNVLPLLTAVKPEKLSATLNAVSQALEGRGERLGETLTTLDGHLKKFNPQLPTLNADIKELVKVSTLYADAAPDVLDALTDATVTSSTLADQEARLAGLYGTTTAAAQDMTSFLRENKDNLIRLSAAGRPSLELLAEYAESFPCTLRTMAGFVPAMDKALGKGTDEPGLHVSIKSVPSKGKYVPGKDTPVYSASGGPACYSV